MVSHHLPITGVSGCTRRERPRSRAAEQRDELAAFYPRTHSITSSARKRIDGGMVRPRACAGLALTTNSSLGVCSRGRWAVWAPLNTVPRIFGDCPHFETRLVHNNTTPPAWAFSLH